MNTRLILSPEDQNRIAPLGDKSSSEQSALVVAGNRGPAANGAVISDPKDLPLAQYIHLSELEIPESFRSNFALYKKLGTVFVVADVDEIDGHRIHDLLRRLALAEIKNIKTLAATGEMVQVAHEQNPQIDEADDTDTEKFLFDLIDSAIYQAASDIHIETRETHADVFFRIAGVRVRQPGMTKVTATNVTRVLYDVHADSDSKDNQWDEKTVQNTVINYRRGAGSICEIRFHSAPIHPTGNFHAVLRLQSEGVESLMALEGIFTPPQCEVAEEMIIGSQGIVILVGPPNSGKSTAMQALFRRMYELRGPEICISTVEDPVEFKMPTAVQHSVNERREGMDFGDLLKATLRQDPDAVMAGEILESVAAGHVKNTVIAGRKVITTLHVFEAFAAFARLRELGIPENVLYMPKFISGIIYRRLLPQLCKCSVPLEENNAIGQLRPRTFKRVVAVLGNDVRSVRVRGPGCDLCGGKGFKDRVPCAEMVIPDPEMLRLLRDGKEIEARKYWMSSQPELDVRKRGISAMAHAISLIEDGLVSPVDVEIALGPIVLETPFGSAPQSATQAPV